MKADIMNKQYWEEVPAEEIIGTQAYPGEELFQLLSEKAEILDLGCGNGEIAEFLAKRDYKVVCVDINRDAIAKNKSKSSSVEYLVGDIMQSLPFPDKSFDAVIASFVLLNMMPVREKVVAELSRVLKPSGLIWFNDALVTESYKQRYELSRPYVDNENDFFVFKKDTPSSTVQTPGQMQAAIHEGKVARITHHFSLEELKELFKDYEEVYSRQDEISSPNSKTSLNMLIAVYQLK
jgi:ubiquinone/menaquinone biosynthesis C-methylase UbiE